MYADKIQYQNKLKKNKNVNNIFKYVLLSITLIVVLLIAATFLTIIFNGISEGGTNEEASWTEILFGSSFNMNDNLAMGIIIMNTILMSFLVLIVATPISVATALFITKIANKTWRTLLISIVSILAAIPSVIYGVFGKYFLLKLLHLLGLSNTGTDATLLSVILILSIMVMPTITLMSTTSLLMVDRKMEDSSEALGATKIQTSLFVTLRAAKTGIIVGMLFALGRCLGEATAISMLSGARPITEGVTFDLMEVSLYMSPVIMGAFVNSSLYEASQFTYIVLSSLLLITIVILFLIIKSIEFNTNDVVKSKRQSKKANEISRINNIVNVGEIDTLNKKEIKVFENYNYSKNMNNYWNTTTSRIRENELSSIFVSSTINSKDKQSSYKKRQSLLFKVIISILSLFGLIALLSILIFLLTGNVGLLFNWNYLSNTGTMSDDLNLGSEYYGLGTAMFGTMSTMFLVLLISMPLGISIAVYTNSYLNKESIFSKIASFAFQIMTSIPAVVYGTLATVIFVTNGWFDTHWKSFEPTLMLVLVILPTVIKQTQEGFKSVNDSQLEGSLALGATTSYTSRRIVLSQSLPSILSATILGLSIVMADSAIFITVLNKPDFQSNSELWIQNGGYTLSTMIYWLSADASANVISNSAALDQMKVIGLLLMILIFWLTLISQKIRIARKIDALLMTIGILLFMVSFWIFGGVWLLCILGIILGIIGIMFESIIMKGCKRWIK